MSDGPLGNNGLIDKLTYRSSAALASRVIANSHLSAITLAIRN